MSLTVLMVTPSTLLMFAVLWLAGAATIVGLFLLNRRRILRTDDESPR